MPNYVDPWGVRGALAPVRCVGARLYGFALRADPVVLDHLARRYLREPSGGQLDHTAPGFFPWVFVTFANISRVQPGAAPYADLGWTNETEVAFWTFLPYRFVGPMPMRASFHVPHIFVDRAEAMLQGRERYGFPKQLASFRFDTDDGCFPRGEFEPGRITASAFGATRFGRDTEWQPYDLISLVPRGSGSGAPEPPGGKADAAPAALPSGKARKSRKAAGIGGPALPLTAREAWQNYGHLTSGLHHRLGEDIVDETFTMLMRTLNGVMPPEGRVAFLKQLPSGGTDDRADFQAVLEAEIGVDNFVRGGMLDGAYDVQVTDSDTHPIIRDLGLEAAPGRPGVFPAHFGWWADLDFTLGPARRLWPTPSIRPARALPSTDPAEGDAAAKPKRRVAILGGGLGAMTAAYWLTHPDNPEAKNLEVTVYQLGARLGGKGASARDETRSQRIEEHGLHVWFGFYFNAVRTMRDCYTALTGSDEGGHRLFDENFEPHDKIVLGEQVPDANGQPQWKSFAMPFPPNLHADGELDAREFVAELFDWLRDAVAQLPYVRRLGREVPPAVVRAFRAVANVLADAWLRIGVWLKRGHPAAGRTDPQGMVEAASGLASKLRRDGPKDEPVGFVRSFVSAFGDAVFAIDRTVVGHVLGRIRHGLRPGADADDFTRRLWVQVDLVLAGLRGIFADDVPERGFDVLDKWTFREWLARHGADPATLESPWVRSMYGIVFAFPGGDTTKPDIGAGTVLRSLLRMLLRYRGSFLWKMRAGMGDAVFAPFHEVLVQRGVRFEFFHRVRSIEADAAGTVIERIRIGRQVRLRDPAVPYQPLVSVKGRPCWPKRPDLSQFSAGDAAAYATMENLPGIEGIHLFESAWSPWDAGHEDEVVLERGDEFDDVVLGISLGALPAICADLVARSERWARMLEAVRTVPTQAFQLWLRSDVDSLRHPDWSMKGAVATAYELPMDSWGDFSQTIPAEAWPAANEPVAAVYFCGVLADDPAAPAAYGDVGYPAVWREVVYREMRRTLADQVHRFWPAAVVNGDFDWSLLVDPDRDGTTGEALLRRQYWTANIDPGERYVLSVKNSVYSRLRSEAGTAEGLSGFANLYLAGDWTRNGLNAGFVESAVVSGMQAARALCGWTSLVIEGETDFRERGRKPEPGLP